MMRRFFSMDTLRLALLYGSALIAAGILVALVIFVLINGIPYLKASSFSVHYNSSNVSMLPALLNTLSMIVLTLLIALPVGVLGAIYLSEYTSPGSRASKWIGKGAELLASVPSIVFGLFGSLFFVRFFGMGLSLLSGALTMSLIVLPGILRTTLQALEDADSSLREASLSLGASRLYTIFHAVLPAALPGILSGTVLAIGRITGESAALIFTAGTAVKIASSLGDSARTLAVHLYALSSEGLHLHETFAAAVILMLVVFLLNLISVLLRSWIYRRQYGK